MIIETVINDAPVKCDCDPNQRLVDFLREEMGLTSVKAGCGEGECGSCSVLFDDKAVTSCSVMVGQIAGHRITTVEGLDKRGELDPVIKSFKKYGAVQCGYCTPGMVISATALLYQTPNPTRDQIKRALEGNLCRCTGYTKIIDAIEHVKEVNHE